MLDDQIEPTSLDPLQIAGVTFADRQIREPELLGAPVGRLDEGPRDVDTENVGAAFRFRHGRRPVAAPEVEHLHALRDPNRFDERVAALPHRGRNTREVALLPECFVRIHRNLRIGT